MNWGPSEWVHQCLFPSPRHAALSSPPENSFGINIFTPRGTLSIYISSIWIISRQPFLWLARPLPRTSIPLSLSTTELCLDLENSFGKLAIGPFHTHTHTHTNMHRHAEIHKHRHTEIHTDSTCTKLCKIKRTQSINQMYL